MDAKRIISWILTIAIVLGLAATGIVAAFAAGNTEITGIEATISGMEVGNPLSGVTVTAPADANYTVSINYISDNDGSFSDFSHVIGNQYYFVSLRFTAKAGYTFSEEDAELEVYADGQRGSSIYSQDTNECLTGTDFNFGTPIDKAEITLTGFEKGKSTSDVKATVPAGLNYKVDEVRFYSEIGIFEGTFENAKYYCEVKLVADKGYRFSDDIDVSINGEGVSQYDVGSEGYEMGVSATLDLRTVIDKVEVTVSGLEKGKNASDVKVTVPEGAKYGVIAEFLFDQNNNDITGKIESGLAVCDIYLRSALGYRFSDNLKVIINGKEDPSALKHNDGDFLNVEKRLELRTLIEKVELTVSGMEKDNDTSAVKATIPGGANYTVEVNVLKQDSSSHNGKMDDYFYTVEVVVHAKDGYYLDENKTVVRYNGSEADARDVAPDQTIMFVNKDYFFGQYIDKVELPAWPTIKVGDEIPMPDTVIGEKYTYDVVWGTGNSSIVHAGDKFENDQLYLYQYLVEPKEGYLFAENVKVTVGGKDNTETMMNYHQALLTFKSYRLGNPKVLDTIQLTGPAPTAGNAPGTFTSTGAHYTMISAMWGTANNDKGNKIQDAGGIFQAGDYVYIGIRFKPERGYALDPNFKIQYNGKSYSPMFDRVTADNNGTIFAVVCLGQPKKAANPDTGDGTPVAVLTVLTVASILGMGVVLSRRKTV